MKRVNIIVGLACLTAIGASAFAQASKPSDPLNSQPASSPASQPETDKAKPAQKKDDKHDKNKDSSKSGPADPGATAPAFKLTDTDGKSVSLSDLSKGGKIVVIQWFNAGCPFVKKHYGQHNTFNDLYSTYNAKGVEFVAICSSAPGLQGAGKAANATSRKDWNIAYPILLDESGEVGRAYGATNTPHMIVIGKDGKVAYNGAIDDDKGAEKPGKTNYVAKALDELLAGTNVTMAKTRAYGCPVKYSK